MAKQPNERVLTKKHLARLERERLQQRYLIIGTIVVAVLILAIVIYGVLDQTVIKSLRPVAKVGTENITTSAFQKEVRFQRSQTIQQLQTYMSDPFIMQIYGSYITQMASQLEQPTTMGQSVLDKLVEDAVVAQEAKKRGITVTDAEVDKAFQEAFGYFPNGTPTPTVTGTPFNTPTLSSQQQTLVPPTATETQTPLPSATSTGTPPTPTGTPPTPTAAVTSTPSVTDTPFPTSTITPTPTPYTKQGFDGQVNQFVTNLKPINYTQADLRSLIRRQVLRQKVFDAVTSDVKASQDEVWARHILVANEADANKVEDLLKKGGNFADLAKQYSTDTSNKDQGGDLGWFPKDQMVTEFADAAFALKVGETSQPVKSTFGYHIIQVLGHETRPLDAQQMQSAKQTEYQAWLDKAKKDLNTQTYDTWTSAIPTDPAVPASLQSQIDQLNAQQQQQQQQLQNPTEAPTQPGVELVTPAP
jgi:peptidyl-prolyl cis-trans isomerase D